MSLLRCLSTRRRREDGGGAAEYALLVAGIAAVIITVVFLFGSKVQGLFNDTCSAISNGATGNISVTC